MNTETLDVTVFTRYMIYKGSLHVNLREKSHRRLSEFLNSNKPFIVLSDVTIHPMPGQTLPAPHLGSQRLPFIHLNTQSIEMVLSTSADTLTDPPSYGPDAYEL